MDRLKAKRSARRTQSTKIINEATTLLQSDCNDRTAFRKVIDKLVASRDELQKINAELEDVIPVDDLEREYESAAHYDDQTLETLTRLRDRLEDLTVGSTVLTPPSTTLNMPPAPTTVASQSFGPRLPTLTIKPFHGDVSQWTSFWEQFNGAVHTNTTLRTTDKFHYLRNYLLGEAAAATAGLPTTEACYESAIDLLKQRFGDRSRIVQHHFRALREMQPVTSPLDTRELRRLYDGVQLNVRCLNVLEVPTSSFAAMLYDLLIQYLPQEIVVAFHRLNRLQDYARGTEPSASGEATTTSCKKLEQLLRYTQIELETREHYAPSASSFKGGGSYRKHVPSSSVMHASVQSKQIRNECFFCKSTRHATEVCNATLTMSEKKNRLAKAMRCYRCTIKGHRANECRRKLVCAACKGRHASTMCDPAFRATRGEKPHNVVFDATKPMKAEIPRSTAVTSCQLDETINLQTFRSWIIGSNETSYVRGIFDGGSQRTFIKEDLVARLGLKIIRETCIAVNTFASDVPSRVRKCNVVEVRLRSQFDDSEYIIEAITMPVICHDISATAMECSFAAKLREQSYHLADDQTVPRGCGEKGISLLIGSDQLWSILSGDIIRSTEVQGLVAVKTNLGWTLQGPTMKTSFINGTSEVMICVLRVQAGEVKGSDRSTLESFWSLDAMGIAPNEATHGHADTMSVFQRKLVKIGKRYQIAVPCKEPDIELLQDNYSVALNRLRNLVKRISKPEGLLERYDTAIRQYIVSGHAEVVLDKESIDGPAYYMPHREVICEDSLTTKLRMDFDASSHAKGERSLNSCLETSPNLNPDLLQVLLRFRWYLVPMTADIEKAFLQVEIRKEDRDLFRFLWFDKSPAVPFTEEAVEV
ncbi:uncharacterized protein LOC119446773 [Dermacentor silvarum]|uniref:uncharacterized protein LOC119446773 n=1 Tax=Dermacentor silvarum TaxID=543639 RepID=UPI002100DCDB|nr:uncharacterized protein LOC119446773 [Dermacentor silvarum]